MNFLLDFISGLLELYVWVIIAQVILSWLIAFNVVNTRNPGVSAVAEFLYQLTEPVMRPIRRRLPNFGNIDISPFIVIVIIEFVRYVVINIIKYGF